MNQNDLPQQPDPAALIVLPPAERARTALETTKTETDLKAMVERTKAITNVVDKNGREEAHNAGMMLKRARTAIAAAGEDAREDAVAFQKAVVAEVKRLTAITADEEKRLLKLRDDFDEQERLAKLERERIEAERVATIRNKIDVIALLPTRCIGDTSDDIIKALQNLALRVIDDEEFGEFADEARAAVDQAAVALINMRDVALAREEAARQEKIRQDELARQAEANRLEVERLKAEQAEFKRKADAERAEQDARIQREREAVAESERMLAKQQAQMQEIIDMQALGESLRATSDRTRESVLVAVNKARAFEPGEYGQMAAMARIARDAALPILEDLLAGMNEPKAEPEPAPGATPLDERVPINSTGQYYSTTTFKENGEPILCNPDGTRSVFCDLTDDMEPEATDKPGIDDSDAVAVMLKYVRELYELGTKSASQILLLVSDELDALEAGEGK